MHRDKWLGFGAGMAMQGLLYHCAACFMINMMYAEQAANYLWLLLIFVPLVLFALARAKIKKLYLFLIIHIFLAVILTFLVPGSIRPVFGGGVLIMLVLSVHERTIPEYERQYCPHIAGVLLFLGVHLAAWYQGFPLLADVCIYEAMTYLVLYVIYQAISSTEEFLSINEKLTNLPAGQISGLNKLLVVFFTVLLVAGMVLFRFLPLGNMFAGIGHGLARLLGVVLKAILRALGRDEETGLEEVQSVEDSFMIDGGTSSALAQFLDMLVRALAVTATVAVLTLLLAKLLYELYKRFYENQHSDTDESEFLLERKPAVERAGHLRRERQRPFGGTPAQRIRRCYRHYVRRQAGRKTVIPRVLTPAELEVYLHRQGARQTQDSGWKQPQSNLQSRDSAMKEMKNGRQSQDNGRKQNSRESQDSDKEQPQSILRMEDVKKRLELYEKARYSQCQCDREDLEEMKQACKENSLF